MDRTGVKLSKCLTIQYGELLLIYSYMYAYMYMLIMLFVSVDYTTSYYTKIFSLSSKL